MRTPRLLAAAAIAALLSACGGGGMQSVPSTTNHQQYAPQPPSSGVTIQSRTMIEDGVTMHVFPARGVTVADDMLRQTFGRARTSGGNLVWNGGPVQTTPKIYIVYWGPKWTTSDPEYTTLNGFMSKMGGGGWINIDTQYSGSNGSISNPSSQLAGTWIDSSAPPSRPSSSAVGAEAQKAAQHFGYGGVNANYIVAIQSGDDPSGFKTQWCAWHSSESESEGVVSYTNLPYQSDAGTSCGSGSVNSPGTYDGVTIVSGHEEAETQTDPQPNTGWLDSGGSEIGDKCAWQNLENNSAAAGYPTQPLWDNKIGGCAQSGP